MDKDKKEKQRQKKSQDKFNSITNSFKPENQNQEHNVRKEGIVHKIILGNCKCCILFLAALYYVTGIASSYIKNGLLRIGISFYVERDEYDDKLNYIVLRLMLLYNKRDGLVY